MPNFELISFATAYELARAVAGAWLDEIAAAQRAGKPHCVALSGGRVTQKFFAATVEFSKARGVPLANVHFFWADERCVPPSDAESNFKMADELLFQPLGIAPDKIHRIHGELPPAEAVKTAEAELARVISDTGERSRPGCDSTRLASNLPHAKLADDGASSAAPETGALPKLDLIFLGMGEDGHIASLFPNATAEIINCPAPFLAVTNSPKPPPNRVTLSYAAIAAAKQVWVLASGKGKEAAFAESLSPTGKTPLARVLQSRSSTKIFTDIR